METFPKYLVTLGTFHVEDLHGSYHTLRAT